MLISSSSGVFSPHSPVIFFAGSSSSSSSQSCLFAAAAATSIVHVHPVNHHRIRVARGTECFSSRCVVRVRLVQQLLDRFVALVFQLLLLRSGFAEPHHFVPVDFSGCVARLVLLLSGQNTACKFLRSTCVRGSQSFYLSLSFQMSQQKCRSCLGSLHRSFCSLRPDA